MATRAEKNFEKALLDLAGEDVSLPNGEIMDWQPIETAPKDGSRLLLATPTGKLADGNWSTRYGVWSWPYVMTDPTHWMPAPPIPNPPKLKPYNA